jgi:hypothetical protein
LYLQPNQEQIQEEKESEYSLDSSSQSNGAPSKRLVQGVELGDKNDTASLLDDVEADFASDQKKFMK